MELTSLEKDDCAKSKEGEGEEEALKQRLLDELEKTILATEKLTLLNQTESCALVACLVQMIFHTVLSLILSLSLAVLLLLYSKFDSIWVEEGDKFLLSLLPAVRATLSFEFNQDSKGDLQTVIGMVFFGLVFSTWHSYNFSRLYRQIQSDICSVWTSPRFALKWVMELLLLAFVQLLKLSSIPFDGPWAADLIWFALIVWFTTSVSWFFGYLNSGRKRKRGY